MKKLISLVIILFTGITFSQVNELIIESGTEFNIPLGAQIASDVINVNQYATFISQDPSGVADGTIINGDGSWALPVELNSFKARANNNQITLNWVTETEVNNYGFDIERKVRTAPSLKMTGWEKVGFVQGNGNTSSRKEYSYVDKNTIGGSKFEYRLKQIDNNGKYKYSDIVEVEVVPTEFALYQNYPNPFNPSTQIRFQLPVESRVSIKIYDILGEEIFELINESKQPGIYEVEFKAENLPSSTYFYRIITNNFTETRKMVLLR